MQQQKKILIKNMLCSRCITVVKSELKEAGFDAAEVSLGEVVITSELDVAGKAILDDKLKKWGFQLLEDKNASLVSSIKQLVHEVYSGEFDFPYHFRFSDLVSARLGKSYDTISSVFSASESTTLEKYIIDYRLQKVKELLVYSGKSLSEIAFMLGFSSVAHLSRQFKSYTGLNPSYFKNIKRNSIGE